MRNFRLGALAVCAALAGAVALGACSRELVAESGANSQSAANLDIDRIASVLSATNDAMTKADSELDTAPLSGRVSQGALEARGAQYALAKASGNAITPLDFTTSSRIAITNSESWPRAIFHITESDSSSSALPVLEVFVQDSARSEYQLTSWARLLGGTQFVLPPVGTGSAYVTGDQSGFVSSPEMALTQYITMINSGTQDTSVFTADEFTKKYIDDISSLNSSVSAAGTVTAQASATDYPVSGLVLQDGSALVSANFTYALTYQRTVAGSTMTLGGQTASLSADGATVQGTATVKYIGTVVMRIPSGTAGGQIQVVGGERLIQSVTLDSSSKPD